MKVILLKDVKNVGKKDEVKEVSDGYARNFLIKNKMAVAYTKGSVKVLDHQLEEKKLHEEDLKKQAEKIAEELKKAGFRIISDGIKVVWTPTEEMLEECKKFGEEFVKYCELNVK